MGPPLEPVSAMVPPDHRAQIKRIGGKQGVSAGLRIVICAGLAALRGRAKDLLSAIDDINAIADYMARTSGRQTPSGAWWAPTEEAAPGAELLDPIGAVVAMPHGVALMAGMDALIVDLQQGQITAIEDGREQAAGVDLQQLAAPIALILPSLIGLAAVGPGRRELGEGLTIERNAADLVRIELLGLGCMVPASIAWQWAAEMAALLARSLERSVKLRSELNRQLQEVG